MAMCDARQRGGHGSLPHGSLVARQRGATLNGRTTAAGKHLVRLHFVDRDWGNDYHPRTALRLLGHL